MIPEIMSVTLKSLNLVNMQKIKTIYNYLFFQSTIP